MSNKVEAKEQELKEIWEEFKKDVKDVNAGTYRIKPYVQGNRSSRLIKLIVLVCFTGLVYWAIGTTGLALAAFFLVISNGKMPNVIIKEVNTLISESKEQN